MRTVRWLHVVEVRHRSRGEETFSIVCSLQDLNDSPCPPPDDLLALMNKLLRLMPLQRHDSLPIDGADLLQFEIGRLNRPRTIVASLFVAAGAYGIILVGRNFTNKKP